MGHILAIVQTWGQTLNYNPEHLKVQWKLHIDGVERKKERLEGAGLVLYSIMHSLYTIGLTWWHN